MYESIAGADANIHCYPSVHNPITFVPPTVDGSLYYYAWVVIGALSILSSLISILNFFYHLRHYHKPHFQRYITRILLICPIYAIDSFFSFRLFWLSVFINVLRDCYEAFVIYQFFCLLINMLGGPQQAKTVFESKPRMRHIFPFCCIVFVPSRENLDSLQRMALQYVLIKPLTAVVACVLHAVGYYCPGNLWPTHGYLYVSAVNFISVSFAMYALIEFYIITEDRLRKFNPIRKFVVIKSIIFVNFWQSVFIAALVYFKIIHSIGGIWNTDNISTELQNALVCFEMFLASIFQWWAFSASEYRFIGCPPTNICSSFLDVLNVRDVWDDTVQSFANLKYTQMRQPNSRGNSFSTFDYPYQIVNEEVR